MLIKNFDRDLKREIKKVSDNIGIKVKESDDLGKMLRDYLTVRLKLIEPKPREVKYNPDFLNTLTVHPQKNIIKKISELSEKGMNLNLFQSKRLLQTGFHDHLLSEWNIYHFHLSLKIDKKSKFVKQVDNLLFCYIDNSQIIFLGTEKHKDGIFGDTKWIEVIHDHYPEVISQYRDLSIKDVSPKVDSVRRQILWNNGYTLGMTRIRDVVYHTPGIGRVTSGHSSSVVSTEISILRWIYKIDKQLDDCEYEICKFLEIEPHNARFKIKFNEQLVLIEQSSNTTILNYPQILLEKQDIINKMNNNREMVK